MKQRIIKVADYLRIKVSEHRLQSQVLGILAVHDKRCYPFAIPNAAKRSPAMAARMKAEGLTAGVADLCIMLPGAKVCWLELKAAKGTQSEAQQKFEDICKVLGHPYAVARTLEEAISVLKEWGALK